MKKIYTATLALILSANAFSQPNHLFTVTNYRGAFEPAPTAMWTDTWCNWDAQNTNYPAPTITISSVITANTTWTSGNTYLIQGLIYVKNGATLTIQPGTVIQGDKSVPNSSLVICTGAQINAVGTVNNPIVFTSNQPAGSRGLGDWGGIILLGKATMNTPGDTGNIEGIAPVADSRYGGAASPDDNDNSGIMQYVRIEFPGYVFSSNKEINGLTMGAVGRGTTLDHIQVSFSNDDAFEWFGGTVNVKYLVAFRCLDDDWDTDNGYSGHVQFCLGVRDPNIADNPSVSTSEGWESDNDANGSINTPLTSAIFANVTEIGPLRGNIAASVATGYRRGARIRRNSNLKIMNCLLMDQLRGVHIDGTACEGNATGGTLAYGHNINAGNQTGKVCEVNAGSTFAIQSWYASSPHGSNDSLTSTTGILINPYPLDFMTGVDYRPASGSIAETGAVFTDPIFCGLIVNTLTPPAISGNNSFCPGSSTTLSAPGGYTYQWSANAGSATTQTVMVNNAGTYTVTITDAYCNTASNTVTTSLYSLPTITVTGNLGVCIGNSTTITGNGATTYTWTSGPSSASYTVSPTTNTTYTVMGTDANGCVNATTAMVMVNALPTITISGNTSICNGSSAVITGNGGTNYLWNTGFPSASYTVNPTTNTSYTVTGTDANTCSNTATVTVVVNALPVLTSTPAISPSNCGQSTGAITNVTVTGNGTITYTWTNSSNTPVGNSSTLNNIPAGTYNLAVVDANGCASSFGPYSIVNPGAPATPTIAVTNTAVCVGQPITFTATTSGSGITYNWTGPNFTSSNQVANLASAAINNNGTYAVTATSANCTSAAATINITVNALPNVGLGVATNTLCLLNTPETLIGVPSGGTFSGTGVVGNTFDPNVSGVGTFTVTYNYTDGNNCSSSATTVMTVNACVGVKENSSALSSVNLFPNPAGNELNINLGTINKEVTLTIINHLGEVVEQIKHVGNGNANNNTIQLNTSDFASGVYFMHVTDTNSRITIKFVITK